MSAADERELAKRAAAFAARLRELQRLGATDALDRIEQFLRRELAEAQR